MSTKVTLSTLLLQIFIKCFINRHSNQHSSIQHAALFSAISIQHAALFFPPELTY
jgi:hypothetical protein